MYTFIYLFDKLIVTQSISCLPLNIELNILLERLDMLLNKVIRANLNLELNMYPEHVDMLLNSDKYGPKYIIFL